MFCKICGAVIEDDSVFCRFCGDKIRPQGYETAKTPDCLFCGKKLLPGALFCIACGKPVDVTEAEKSTKGQPREPKTVVCPDCGKIMEAERRFCRYCGGDTRPSATDEAAEIEPWLDIEDAPVLVIPGAHSVVSETLTPEEIKAQTVEDLPVQTKINCPFCGKSLESHMIYCIFCGERVRNDEYPGIGSPSEFFNKLTADGKKVQRCPFCFSEVNEKQRFCVKCGAFIAEDAMRTGEIAPRICGSCRKPLKPGAKYCVFCGIPVAE